MPSPRRHSAATATDAVGPVPAVLKPKRLGADWREITFARHSPKVGPPPVERELRPTNMKFMSAMTREEIMEHLHHADATLPPVRPCDTPNGSDKKTNWSVEDLHALFTSMLITPR